MKDRLSLRGSVTGHVYLSIAIKLAMDKHMPIRTDLCHDVAYRHRWHRDQDGDTADR